MALFAIINSQTQVLTKTMGKGWGVWIDYGKKDYLSVLVYCECLQNCEFLQHYENLHMIEWMTEHPPKKLPYSWRPISNLKSC